MVYTLFGCYKFAYIAAGAAQAGTRSAPGSETRAPPAGGLGGASMPDLTSLLGGGMPDPSHFNQILQNPAMMQLMQNLMSDPQTFNQVNFLHLCFAFLSIDDDNNGYTKKSPWKKIVQN